jgi:hypothetical protein
VRRTAPVAAVRRRLGQAESRPVADHVVRRPRTGTTRRATRLATTLPSGRPTPTRRRRRSRSLDSPRGDCEEGRPSRPLAAAAARRPLAGLPRLLRACRSRTSRRRRGSRPTRSTASPPCSSTSCATSRRRTSR